MKTLYIPTIALFCLISLTGCANNSALVQTVEDLSIQVDTLSYQVTSLQKKLAIPPQVDTSQIEGQLAIVQDEVATIFASSALAYDEAKRANKRIDNMAQSYTK